MRIFEKEFRTKHPETIGETDKEFDNANYTEFLETELSNRLEKLSYASPASSGVQNGGSWQKCPKCDGRGIVSKPPWVAGDVNEWTSTQTSYPCNLCGGMKVIKQ